MARKIWPSAAIVMVEANQLKLAHLTTVAKKINATVQFSLLGAEDGRKVEFHVMESGSSVLGEISPLPRTTEPRALRTLDTLLPGLTHGALLKVDAQGYELEILRGARRALETAAAILLEISIIGINEGAPLLDEVIPFMKQRGFVAYDIFEIHRRPLDGALNQVDIIFVREDSALISDKRHFA
jgi:FkbM family methyltransferase